MPSSNTPSEADLVRAREILIEVFEERFAEVRGIDDFERGVDADAESLRDYLIDRDCRTFCILAVSFMEDTLRRTFMQYWGIDSKLKESTFFGGNGPLSTFSQRITVASGLQWITDDMAEDAHRLRRIRNEFAHSHRVHSVDQEPMLSLASALRPIEKTWSRESMPVYQKAYAEASRKKIMRMRIYANAMKIVSSLLARSKLIKHELPPTFRVPAGWAGLTAIEQSFIDHTIRHCFRTLGIKGSGALDESPN